MTRINVVHPSELSNAHLMAEYRELPRIFLRALQGPAKIPSSYRLGTGHVLFFVDKCAWLYDRWNLLRIELVARGYNLGQTFQTIVRSRARRIRKLHAERWNQWLPTDDSHLLNRQRIAERS